jgi:two-component system, sensor histidine kinase and response regulator
MTTPLILIVEDDPTVSNLLETLMQMEGYETLTAKDGLEGLLKAEFRHPSLILLDVMMPNVDGERVMDEMHERPELANVPVLIVTGRADAHDAFDPVVGHDNVITKPFDAGALAHRVAQLLGTAREDA